MRKNIIFYFTAFTLLILIFLYFNKLLQELSRHAALLNDNSQLQETISTLRTWLIPFIILSGILLIYTTSTLSSQKSKTKTKEKEIEEYKYALDESAIVAITNQKGIIKYVNNNFCKISKYNREELIGQDHRIINSGYHPKEFIRNLWVTIANGKIWKGELKNRAKDGTIYWVDTTIVPFLNEQGKPYQYLAIRADITERKQAELNIIELNRDLEDKIAKRTEQLKKSNEELESFSYSVSHDLRTPLRAIVGYAGMLEEDYSNQLDEEGKRITASIKSNTLKMSHLIDDLLGFARISKQELVKTTINSQLLVKQVIAELTPSDENKAIIWNIQTLPSISGDLNTIRQVWLNLISNAIKYSSKKTNPHIEIGSYTEGEQIVFFVKDNGAGFNEKYKNKLFKVFQRLHSMEEFEGTGVGLAIVEKVIYKHGGKVWGEGEKGIGACFYFSLPVKKHKLSYYES